MPGSRKLMARFSGKMPSRNGAAPFDRNSSSLLVAGTRWSRWPRFDRPRPRWSIGGRPHSDTRQTRTRSASTQTRISTCRFGLENGSILRRLRPFHRRPDWSLGRLAFQYFGFVVSPPVASLTSTRSREKNSGKNRHGLPTSSSSSSGAAPSTSWVTSLSYLRQFRNDTFWSGGINIVKRFWPLLATIRL